MQYRGTPERKIPSRSKRSRHRHSQEPQDQVSATFEEGEDFYGGINFYGEDKCALSPQAVDSPPPPLPPKHPSGRRSEVADEEEEEEEDLEAVPVKVKKIGRG